MMISEKFDIANSDRKKAIFNKRIQKAKSLNDRMVKFLNNVDQDYSLTEKQKEDIRQQLIYKLNPIK